MAHPGVDGHRAAIVAYGKDDGNRLGKQPSQIRALGGDAHGKTEKALLVERESKGIEEVILGDDATLPQMFHALMAAELVDNAGWDLLVELADEADDRPAKKAFKKRLHEEEEHLVFVRRAIEKFALREVLAAPAPTAP